MLRYTYLKLKQQINQHRNSIPLNHLLKLPEVEQNETTPAKTQKVNVETKFKYLYVVLNQRY